MAIQLGRGKKLTACKWYFRQLPSQVLGGIAPFYTVPLEPFGTRPQCPDDAATGALRRKKLEE